MNQALSKWLAAFRGAELPGIRYNIDQVRMLANRPHINMDELAHVMERDIGLSLRLMRRVNTMQQQRKRQEIGSLHQAMMMIGIEQLPTIPKGLPTLESLDKQVLRPYLQIHKRIHHAAIQAYEWAKIRRDPDPREIFQATIFNAVGELLLWIKDPERMRKLTSRIEAGKEPADAEYLTLGFTIDELTKELAKIWVMPPLVIASLYPENVSNPRVLTIRLAVELSYAAERDWYSRTTRRIEESVAGHLGRSREQAIAEIHRIAAEAARQGNYIRLPDQGMRLLYPPYPIVEEALTNGDQPADTSVATSAAESEADKNNLPRDHGPCDRNNIQFCLAPQMPVVARNLRILTEQKESLVLKDVIQHTMLAMHDGLALNRVVFALLQLGQSRLKARSIIGSERDLAFNQFSVDLKSGSLFEALINKPQPLWVDEHNWRKLCATIPVEFLQQIHNDSFYVMPVTTKAKTIGIFYADRSNGCCRLDPRSFKLFQRLVQQAALNIEHLSHNKTPGASTAST